MKSVFLQIVLECLILGAQIIKNTKIHMCPILKNLTRYRLELVSK